MKHEPRQAIHVEKQLQWVCNLGGAESLGISKAGQTVLIRLIESQICYQLAGSGPGQGGLRKGKMASACPDATHVNSSLESRWSF